VGLADPVPSQSHIKTTSKTISVSRFFNKLEGEGKMKKNVSGAVKRHEKFRDLLRS